MANNYQGEVTRYLRQKSANGFDAPITYLGAEQRFVTALRNSSVNNLEEQFLFGTDTITKTKKDNGDTVIEKFFYVDKGDGSTPVNYYKLVSRIHPDSSVTNSDFYYDDNYYRFYMGAEAEEWSGETLLLTDNTLFSFGNNDETMLKVFPRSYSESRIDKLYFVNSTEEVLVLTKITTKVFEDEGRTEVVKEKITNHLI